MYRPRLAVWIHSLLMTAADHSICKAGLGSTTIDRISMIYVADVGFQESSCTMRSETSRVLLPAPAPASRESSRAGLRASEFDPSRDVVHTPHGAKCSGQRAEAASSGQGRRAGSGRCAPALTNCIGDDLDVAIGNSSHLLLDCRGIWVRCHG